MECLSCKRMNRAGSGFCLGCGSPLSLSCPACGHELPPDAAFCDGCGHFGKSVVQAFRTADLAGGGEILVSSPTKELVDGAGDVSFDQPREVELKGLEGKHRVFSVHWQ